MWTVFFTDATVCYVVGTSRVYKYNPFMSINMQMGDRESATCYWSGDDAGAEATSPFSFPGYLTGHCGEM